MENLAFIQLGTRRRGASSRGSKAMRMTIVWSNSMGTVSLRCHGPDEWALITWVGGVDISIWIVMGVGGEETVSRDTIEDAGEKRFTLRHRLRGHYSFGRMVGDLVF
jgi:hypothetical protein